MSHQGWVPPGIDPTKPNIARVYDFQLGGKDNYAVDRQVGREIQDLVPEAPAIARTNRAFLRRAVRFMIDEAGIRQFIDIGSGLPTQGNVHEVAEDAHPGTRVVYIDNDPVVLVHARALLDTSDATKVIKADLRRPDELLDDPVLREFIDFDQPVGLLLIAILHHLNDDERPAEVTARLSAGLASGSHLAISHFHNPGSAMPEEAALAEASEKLLNDKFGSGRFRSLEEIRALFGDFELLEPGLVPLPLWRPEGGEPPELVTGDRRLIGGVARKP
ncbi:MAG TPA: SAM-dependent methyltransferase [Streptosporangiaceae bacterium]|nr:SAM-dependent methyltransferase [Streptosporangiaceae bacterium]